MGAALSRPSSFCDAHGSLVSTRTFEVCMLPFERITCMSGVDVDVSRSMIHHEKINVCPSVLILCIFFSIIFVVASINSAVPSTYKRNPRLASWVVTQRRYDRDDAQRQRFNVCYCCRMQEVKCVVSNSCCFFLYPRHFSSFFADNASY